MRLTDLSQENLGYLQLQDFENILNVGLIDNKYYIYNLNSTLYIKADSNNGIQTYVLRTAAHWPLISYLIYGTTRLWWLLCKLNDENINNIFNAKEIGTEIKYIDKGSIQKILDLINS